MCLCAMCNVRWLSRNIYDVAGLSTYAWKAFKINFLIYSIWSIRPNNLRKYLKLKKKPEFRWYFLFAENSLCFRTEVRKTENWKKTRERKINFICQKGQNSKGFETNATWTKKIAKTETMIYNKKFISHWTHQPQYIFWTSTYIFSCNLNKHPQIMPHILCH